jgi:hypothetical protein
MCDEERERPAVLGRWTRKKTLVDHEQGPGGIRWGGRNAQAHCGEKCYKAISWFSFHYHISLTADERGSDDIWG